MGPVPADPGGGGGPSACSICLEPVDAAGGRSTARLHCGHEFHLDCIGSAFNSKGMMQCPNCRKVENGNWLYAKSGHSVPDLNLGVASHDDDFNHSNPEMPFESHWFSLHRYGQVPSSLEGFEALPESIYPSHSGHYSNFFGRTSRTIMSSCPYLALFQVQPFPFEGDSDPPQENHVVGAGVQISNALSRQESLFDVWGYHSFIPTPPPYHTPDPNRPSTSSATTSRRYDVDSLLPTSGSIYQQFTHGSGSSDASSFLAPNLGNSRPQSRSNQQYEHQPLLGMLNSFSDLHQPGASASLPPTASGYSASSRSGYYLFPHFNSPGWVFQDMESLRRGQAYAWEGDRVAPFPLMSVGRGLPQQGATSFHSSNSSSGSNRAGLWNQYDAERSSRQR